MRIDQITETEAAYIAGLLDGEGTIRMTRNQSKSGDRKLRYRVCLTVAATTSPDLVAWLMSTLDVQVCPANRKVPNPGHKMCWMVRMSEKPGEELLKRLLPYLVIKKRQAEMFLRYREIQKACTPSLRWSNDRMLAVRVLRDWFFNEFHRLNARGSETVTANTPETISEAEIVKIESDLHGDVQRASGDTRPRLLM